MIPAMPRNRKRLLTVAVILVTAEIAAVVILLALRALSQDRPVQLRLSQARIALANDQGQTALRFLDTVLCDDPGNFEALEMRARALLRLGQLDTCRQLLGTLLQDHPQRARIRRLFVEWAFCRMGQALSSPSFPISRPEQEKFAAAGRLCLAQADWLARDGAVAEAGLIRACWAAGEAQRLGRLADHTADRPHYSRRHRRLARTRRQQAQRHLAGALADDPQLWAAWDMTVRLHQREENWPALLAVGRRLCRQNDVPADLAKKMTVALLSMPDSVEPPARRVALGWSLQDRVPLSQRHGPAWKLAAAALHLAGQLPRRAERLAREILQDSPGHVNARYLLARSLCSQRRYEQARPILRQLTAELPHVGALHRMHQLTLARLPVPNDPQS